MIVVGHILTHQNQKTLLIWEKTAYVTTAQSHTDAGQTKKINKKVK